jgi:quercetin dioxygenase-like cupin family protein
MTAAEVAAMQDWFFMEVGDSNARVDTSRHPMMHTTATVDYILLLSGEISLLLDEGDPIKLKPFDAVVQRATNHSWVNTGAAPALLMCVMVGGK